MSTETRLMVLESKIKELEAELDAYKVSSAAQFQTVTAATVVESTLEALITALTTTVTEHTAKFALVNLPSESQYYLRQNDIVGLKKIVAQAAALKSEVDKQMSALISAWRSFKAQQNI